MEFIVVLGLAAGAACRYNHYCYIDHMCRCIHARVALGLIVGCLPAAPDFLRWVGKTHVTQRLRTALRLPEQWPGNPASQPVAVRPQNGRQEPLDKPSADASDKT
jgi:hypothetical protein